MEQFVWCNYCGLMWMVWFNENPDDADWTCPACGSDDTTCV